MIKFILGVVIGVIWGVISVLIIWEEDRRRRNLNDEDADDN